MKFFKKIAELFTKKGRTAQKEQGSTGKEATNSFDKACMVQNGGKAEYPLFAPQPLLSWYCMQKAFSSGTAVCANVSQVSLLDLFHPLTEEFITAVFAIKDEQGYFWGEVGTRDIYFSEKNAFIYRTAKTIRVYLPAPHKRRIAAVCKYKNYQLSVEKLIEELETPPANADKETIIPCPHLPCNLPQAAEFVKKL